MKIYILSKQKFCCRDTVCVSEDINKIRKSICEDLIPNEDYPELEIWKNEELILQTTGGDVLKKVASEINELDSQ